MNPHLLAFYNKDNLRKLSTAEGKDIEIIKTKLLFSLNPMSSINEDILAKTFSSIEMDNDIKELYLGYQYWIKQIGSELNRTLTLEENKLIKASFYATVYDN